VSRPLKTSRASSSCPARAKASANSRR